MDRFFAVHESDIDLLLLEEFCCSDRFVSWFYSRARKVIAELPKLTEMTCKAKHSVSYSGQAGGESDLEALISGQHGSTPFTTLFLIEDKINAQFTLDQPQRYRRRAEEIARRNAYDANKTVLFAPNNYLEGVERGEFDFEISYEDIIGFFDSVNDSSNEELKRRAEHRTIALRHAISRSRRGGIRINDDQRTRFFDDYFAIANKAEPLLVQKPSRDRTANSDQFLFELPKRLTRGAKEYITHQMKKGRVAIELRGLGKHRDELSSRLREIVDEDMLVVCPPKRKFIRVQIHGFRLIDLDQPANCQQDVIEDCAHAAARLQKWHQEHYASLKSWIDEFSQDLD